MRRSSLVTSQLDLVRPLAGDSDRYAGNVGEYVAYLRPAPCLQVGHLSMGLLIEQHMHASRSHEMHTEVPDHRRTATNDTCVIRQASTAGKEVLWSS